MPIVLKAGMQERETHHFQVILQLAPDESEPTDDDLAEFVEHVVALLVARAPGLALGPVGGANLAASTIEILFTIKASGLSDVNDKLGKVAAILEADEEHDFRFEGSSTRREDREPVPA